MPDEGKNFGSSLSLDLKNDDVTCKPRICSLAPQSLRFGWFFRFCFKFRQSSFHWIISDGVVNGILRNGNVLILPTPIQSSGIIRDSARDSNSDAMVWVGNSASRGPRLVSNALTPYEINKLHRLILLSV